MYPIRRRRLTVLAAVAGLLATAACSGGSPGSGSGGDLAGAGTASSPAVSASAGVSAPGPSTPGPSNATGPAATSSSGGLKAGTGFTVVATGDVLLHPPLWAQARRDAVHTGKGTMDFAPMLAGVKPYVSSADLAICHLETPLAPAGGPFTGYPNFSGPPQISTALASTGYDVCSTASNHTLDQGAAGITRTLNSLDTASIAHAGSARSPAESRRITLLTANGVRVAFLSYAFGFNGHSYPGGQRWRANLIDPGQILADARRARADGAQAVVLALHWGTEYSQVPSAQQRALAPKLARSGLVDLIISHHAHVVEPIKRIGRTWVVYGLGNLLADHSTPGAANSEGLLVRFSFTRTSSGRYTATRAEYLPLLMTKTAPLRVLDVPGTLRSADYGSTTRSRLLAALTRTTRVVRSLGATKQGLTPISP